MNDPGPLELQGSSGPWNENLAQPRPGGLRSTADFNLLILFLAFLHATSPAHPSPLFSAALSCGALSREPTRSLRADSLQTLTPDPLQELPVPRPSKHRALASLSSPPHPTLADNPKGPGGAYPTGLVAVSVSPAGIGICGSSQELVDIPVGSGAPGALSGSQEEQNLHQAGSS